MSFFTLVFICKGLPSNNATHQAALLTAGYRSNGGGQMIKRENRPDSRQERHALTLITV